MEHLNMQSMDKVAANVAKIRELFPNCVTERINKEGKLEHAIDFDMLKQELSDYVVDGLQERYQFTWPDKRKAILAANAPINKTLRPCREESVDFDNTENLYIEGDNLEVLKLLQETYLGKVKMIYIDPPYNTGNDFVYRDDFKQNAGEYVENSGQLDDEGNRMVTNTESNGRFHTDWLNMMYPRLKLAKDLLSDDGIIFISIGQTELDNLDKILSDIFGEANKISSVVRVMKSGGAKGRFFSPNVEFILIYAKNIDRISEFREAVSEEIIKKLYTSVEQSGERKGEKYRPFGLYQSSLDSRPNQRYYIQAPDGELIIPPGDSLPNEKVEGAMVLPASTNDKVWRWSKERFLKEKEAGNIEFKRSNGVLLNSDGNPASWNVYTKIWLSDRQDEGSTPVDLISKWENRHSAKELKELEIPFEFAKPTGLIHYLMTLPNISSGDTVLDFFSGSATTAHAVMQLNAEDGGKRKFIMVQLPEDCAEDSEAYKAGYKNICEIGKERIRRAGKKIKEENPLTTQDLDIGFRVLKCDSSNMEDVYFTPKEYMDKQQSLFVDNIKKDRNDEDLLFDAMLKLDTPLSSKIEKITIAGKTVYNVAQGHLMACFDKNVTDEVITAIAKEMPSYFVMRDSSQADDSVAINFEQIFNTYSPQTVRRVL
ncbi:site-specific DNA-methyltransferase [Phascolarctobacterium succinatutens]|uniref:site-specific DNA-methyltransferase n=1 Tax=Phascolarctobacterium succinatutens TaxID=626940 RepID=UPI0026ECE1A6|nr:site-specific DNA-methyltransferase [Phascolarctobacterium succinatutens]